MLAASRTESSRSLVLIVEDDDDVRRMLEFNLRAADFEVEAVGNGAEAADLAASRGPSLVILDRMLGDKDGLDVCREIREIPHLAEIAILVLTARGTEGDRLDGFAAGVDDYVVKPFSVRELVARARVLTALVDDRRDARRNTLVSKMFRWRELFVDVTRRQVLCGGATIELRPIEFTLLVCILEAPQETLTRQKLFERVWGGQFPASLRTVDVHVRRLRQRLGDHADVVETVHGEGYRLAKE